MPTQAIRQLFPPGRIDRKIEEVIKVDQDDVAIVRQEIDDYILTESIERNMLRVLEGYREAPNRPSGDIAIWVAGFFGAGKSSFAKYLGLAISNRDLGGESAGDLLAQRANSLQIKALLGAIKEQIPTEAIIFDVSADRNVNASEALTKIFYRKLLDHLGYSSSLEVAELEIELEQQERIQAFLDGFAELYPNEDWAVAKTRLLQAMPRASAVMHALEPQTYAEKDSWLKNAREENVPITPASLAERTIELLERKHPGKQLIFVVDEVGQYVARDIQKMLDLQAIVQQLGVKGRGRVWVMVTSQERLSDVVGALDDNRPELARLQDRFPYKPLLEPSDIAEVTSRRVLGKSSQGEAALQALFQQHQGRLATHTKLDTKIRLPELTAKAFADLYPLLPYQIELIIMVVSGLRLSGGASKQFGGANRAIIKLAQELLTNPQSGLADQSVGELVTLDRVYDLQSNNIDSQYRGKISDIATKASHPLAASVAKAICLLQFADQVPVSERNIAVVLHPRVDADSLESEVREACEHLVDRNLIRKADGQYRIPKPEEEDWEQVRSQQAPSAQDRHGLLAEALKRIWEPVPSAALGHGVKTFKAGLLFRGTEEVKGDVPVRVERVDGSEDFDNRVEQLRQQSQKDANTFFWAMRPSPELERALGEWFRSQKVIDLKGRDASSKGQVQLVSEERRKLDGFRQQACQLVDQALIHGAILLNGGPCNGPANPAAAVVVMREVLREGLAQIYGRFCDAPVNPSGDELTDLLNADNLKGLTGSIETLKLCKEEGGQWLIDTSRPALKEVLNRIRLKGGQSGKELVEWFGDAPFGWTLDAVRFLMAALQHANQLKATHNAQSYVGTANPQVRPLFTNNTSFRATAFAIHEASLSHQAVLEASQLFNQFAGKTVLGIAPGPLAKEIRSSTVALTAEINAVSRAMTPLDLPGREAIDKAIEQLSTWQDSDDEEVVKGFRASAAAVKEQWQRALAIKEVLEARSTDLKRARHALSEQLWGQLQKESDLPAELEEAHEDLSDRMKALSFYEKLPEIDQLTKKLEVAYDERREQAQQALATGVQQRLTELERTPGFAALDPQVKEQLRQPLQKKASDGEGMDLVRLRDQPAMLEGLLRQQKDTALNITYPPQEVSTVSVRELCREPFDAEGLEEVLDRIRQRCEEELGNDRKVLLQ
ncbi:BREX system P-loop protein BrxC [Synechococcus sp. CCY 0621]|uniref:BREX system P-loop protein BrxC n=1 Tax=Synechococcus sp. CCY 0621 TaxID=2815603 RepID=UPI001C227A4E|nr:BREX system P-loop protein BrxC [Synechococcus sp. CCY 0621]